jgi:BMFP domain-containing protein YqiC
MDHDVLAEEMLGGLTAYVKHYGLPESPAQVSAIVGALINVKTQGQKLSLTAQQVDQMIQRVTMDFDAKTIAQAVVDRSKQTLADQAHQWRHDLEQQVRGVLDAYRQHYAPGVNPDSLPELVTAIAPMVKDGRVTKPEVMDLVQQMTRTLAPTTPLSAVLNPNYLALAQDVAIVFQQKNTAAAVSETVTAYVEKFAPAAQEIGEDLIERALGAILRNKVEFGIDTELNLADKRLIIQQVSFKLNILKQSPLPSKSAKQVAEELNSEIERFKAERQRQLGALDLTAGHLSRDGLSISSNWVFTDRTPTDDAIQD